MSSDDAQKLWKVYRTAKELVKDRGYTITEKEVNLSFDQFVSEMCDPMGKPIKKKMCFMASPSPEAIEKFPEMGNIWVEFCEEASVTVKTMRNFCIHISENKFATGILVYENNMTPSANRLIPSVAPATIDTFQETDLLVNITKHVLVPTHIKLSGGEKKYLLERYRLKESQLPRIQREDPVARYLGLRRGQIVKIIRRSETSGRYASYRICL